MKIRILDHPGQTMTNVTESPQTTGLHATRNHIPLIARILLSAIFIWSGINKILDPTGTQQFMASKGLPFTGLLLVVAIAVELLGGLSVLLGFKARIGAALLVAFLVPTTLIFHTNLGEPLQQIMLMKNLAIMGGLLMIVQYGVGQIALRSD